MHFTGGGDYPEAPAASETEELATGAGLKVCASVSQSRREPHPKTFLGAGKVDELKALMAGHEADLLLLNANPLEDLRHLAARYGHYGRDASGRE